MIDHYRDHKRQIFILEQVNCGEKVVHRLQNSHTHDKNVRFQYRTLNWTVNVLRDWNFVSYNSMTKDNVISSSHLSFEIKMCVFGALMCMISHARPNAVSMASASDNRTENPNIAYSTQILITDCQSIFEHVKKRDSSWLKYSNEQSSQWKPFYVSHKKARCDSFS